MAAVAVTIAALAGFAGGPVAGVTATSLSFAPVADAYVNSAKAGTNYGAATTLRVDGSPAARAYLRFTVSGVTAPVTKATLRLYAKNSSSVGVSVWAVANTTWGEKTITWSNAPALATAALASSGAFGTGWVAVDVTALVSANATFTVAVTTPSSTATTVSSREAGASVAPQLVVETQAAPANTSPPTISGTAQEGQALSAAPGGWSGTQPIGYAYQWQRCDSDGAACLDLDGATGPSYTLLFADVGSTLRVRVTASNSAGTSSAISAATAVVVAASAGSDPVIAAAGDIACNGAPASAGASCHFGVTADEIAADPTITDVLTLGDNQYDCGEYENFLAYYDPTWGVFKSKTHPAVGNHEYQKAPTTATCAASATTAGKGYFDYWNGVDVVTGAAGDRARGYYSYDVGTWHLIALNSNCAQVGGCGAGSPQELWLKNDLETHTNACTMAYWHHPRFSSGGHGNTPAVAALWDDLYAAGAEIVLNGHDHVYERFAPQAPAGLADPAYGLREFIVGTGGKSHALFGALQPNSEIRNADTFGILKLTLHAQSYDWQFVPEPGRTFSDAGSAPCHTPNADVTPPTPPTNLAAVVAGPNEVDLSWTPSVDNQLVAGYKILRGGVPIGTTATPSYADTSVTGGTTYMYEVQAYDLVGNTSSSAGITVTTPGTLVTFTPTADAYVQADAPSSNYGASTQIVNDNSPVKNLLLKFEVTGLSGRTILSARLRLYCLDPSSVGGDFWPVDDTNWSETNVTWNTAPAAGALKIGSIGAVVAGNSYELDVTSLIGGDGIYSIKGTSTSSDGAYYASKERANPPQLLITVR